MPRIAIDYSKTVIYKIVCNDLTVNDVYVGSTTDFTRRKSEHKHHCNNPISKKYNFNVYQSIRSNGGWENWSMILIENFPCENGNESLARERSWVDELGANLNKQVPSKYNKLGKVQYNKEYYCDKKVEISARKKIIILCSCGVFFTKQCKAQHERTQRHLKHFEIINCCIPI
jgi:hypothetical protein